MAASSSENQRSKDLSCQIEEVDGPGYQTIPFKDIDKAGSIIKEDGLVVITDVFTSEECLNFCNGIINDLCAISPNLDPEHIKQTWRPENLPSGPRDGMFHSLVANFPSVWKVRSDERFQTIFSKVYSELREYPVHNFFTSLDGINVRPHREPFHDGNDWAHLDQTIRNNKWWCVQGQVVLSDTSACFRASPKSCHVFDKILDLHGVSPDSTSNWCMVNKKLYRQCQDAVESVGGKFQIPIRAPKGSVILWSSTTLHSAMLQQEKMRMGQKEDPWADWRFVVYVCYRPQTDCNDDISKRLDQCVKMNRVTNHSISKIFPLTNRKGARPAAPIKKTKQPTLEDMTLEPTTMYKVLEKPPQEAVTRLTTWQ
tara:strand:- start:1577 stop:2683 length:1107 start_codon:yes stop_codon:yes gene_type:complete